MWSVFLFQYERQRGRGWAANWLAGCKHRQHHRLQGKVRDDIRPSEITVCYYCYLSFINETLIAEPPSMLLRFLTMWSAFLFFWATELKPTLSTHLHAKHRWWWQLCTDRPTLWVSASTEVHDDKPEAFALSIIFWLHVIFLSPCFPEVLVSSGKTDLSLQDLNRNTALHLACSKVKTCTY